ncbi:MAG: DinB family protein, partial [Caldilineaceae bacterium]
ARAASSQVGAKGAAQFRHVIGIERWAQSRLRVLLGEPLRQDECDGYMPEASLGVAQLREVMRSTRSETVALARSLAAADVSLEATVPHNDFGPLTARGWLAYVNDHGTREAMRIR